MQPGDSGTLERLAVVLNLYLHSSVHLCLGVCGTVSMVVTKATCQ